MKEQLRLAGARIFRNFMMLVGGRFFGGLLALGATVISARTLGVESFGVLVLIHAYVSLVRGIVNLKPFEAIIRFGAPLLDNGDFQKLFAILRATLAIDVIAAIIGTIGAFVGIEIMTLIGGWDTATAEIARWYVLLLITCGYGTASGVLRICDRFDAISLALVLGNGFRFAGVAVLSTLPSPSLTAFASVWATSFVVRFTCIHAFGWRVAMTRLPMREAAGKVSFREVARTHPGIWQFIHVVYWNSTLDLIPKSVSTLGAGALLGPEHAGLFRIAREVANVVSKPALLIRQAVFPDFTRLHEKSTKSLGPLVVTISFMLAVPAFALTVVAAFFGEPALIWGLGNDYAGAAQVLVWLTFAAALEVTAAPLRPAAYALSMASATLFLQVAAVIIFIYLLLTLTPNEGLIGIGIASVGLWSLMLLGMMGIVTRALKNRDEQRIPG